MKSKHLLVISVDAMVFEDIEYVKDLPNFKKLLEKVNRYAAILCAAIAAPVVNTGVFFLGCHLFFFEDIASFFEIEAEQVTVFIITVLIGINFIIELLVNIVLAPTVCRILDINDKHSRRGYFGKRKANAPADTENTDSVG